MAEMGTSEMMDSTAEMIWETAGAVMVGKPAVGSLRASVASARTEDTTEFTTEMTVPSGADGTMAVASETIESTFVTRDATGRLEISDSIAETTGTLAVGVIAEGWARMLLASDKASDTTLLTMEITVATGAEGRAAVASEMIESTLDVSEATGNAEMIDSIAETIGRLMEISTVGFTKAELASEATSETTL